MIKVHSVLLEPHEGDPYGLLADGPCGERAPQALRCWPEYWTPVGSVIASPGCRTYDPGAALVLAWGGKIIRAGCYRVADAIGIAPSAVPGAIQCVLDGDPMLRSISDLATIVLLDADGKEIPSPSLKAAP